MKIAVISSRFPFPLEKGDKLRLFFQIKELARNNEIHLHSICEETPSEKDFQKLNKHCASINIYPLSRIRRLKNMAFNVLRGEPFQLAYFRDRGIKKEIEINILEQKPDIIYCQLFRVADYIRKLPFVKAIDYMDAFSEIMKREGKQTKSVFYKTFFQTEAKRIAKYEAEINQDFELKTIISEQDRDLLSDHVSDLEIIRNGVDTDYFTNEQAYPRYDLAFIGNMGYRPNVAAASYITSSILPLLLIENPLIRILIAGARPSKKVVQMNGTNVTVLGWMDDIRDAYSSAKVFVAPIFSGAGQQNKILEAMSMGIPCVTSSLVNNGIRAIPDEQIAVADTPDEFVTKIKKLLEDQEYYNKLQNSGRAFVVENFTWEKNAQKLELLLQKKSVNINE